MEDQERENLDGSSIKPVSSLRSHFEQMAKSFPKTVAAPPRPISPKPKIFVAETTADSNLSTSSVGQTNLRQPISNGYASLSAPPNHGRERPTSTGPVASQLFSPEVNIEPPSSPPRTLNLNHTLTSPSGFLNVESHIQSSASGASSPRHFRIPSRPQTPLLEPRKALMMPAVQPPEPPPPRRSAELRRDAGSKSLVAPPPVKRSEKPKAPGKQLSRGQSGELIPVKLPVFNDKASPFSTPPSSDSSPGLDQPPLVLPRPDSVGLQPRAKSPTPVQKFEPPPIHHSVASLRKEMIVNGQIRSNTTPLIASDQRNQRPILPVRPHGDISSNGSVRGSSDTHRPSKISSAPIDTLRSANNGGSISKDVESEISLPTLPKRNFSTPISQLQTPPRAHGRSMTVDQASDRVPVEFRATEKIISIPKEHETGIIEHVVANEGTVTPLGVVDYPNPSFSNRRPPYAKHGATEILTKFDARIFDVCGDFVCASGHYTRVWSLRDGEQIMNLSHGDAIKILSVAFKSAAHPLDEGSRIWLGNNFGELVEVKILSQTPIVATNSTAHNRREILKIYRHKSEMWTLDESGTLHVWASDSTGPPNLESPTVTYRVPKGHTYSMLVKDQLWYATGSDIRIFVPSVDGRSQFQVLQRPLSQPGTGEVTSGTMVSSQPGRVYFGHSDGRISMYSAENYTCLGTINVSMYKINSLMGVGAYLWAAYNTGMIYVYDITQTPWVVKKDWRAHPNPVIGILIDRSSFWKLERCQVVSQGADNALRLWDGLLEDDWLETELQAQDEKYCKMEQFKTLVMTWNAGAATPHSLRYDEQDTNFLPNLLKESGIPDILVFNFQELVDLEDKKTTAKSFFSKTKKKDASEPEHMSHQYRDWRDYLIRCLDDSVPRGELYHLLSSNSLVGLFTCIFVRARLRDRIKGVTGAEVKRGMGGRAGNKGALILRFMVDDTSLCFVNCHLAAGQNQTKDRNFDVSSILDSTVLPGEERESVRFDSYIGGGDGTMILDHEICILSGDLNYRIDTMNREAVISALNSGKMNKLLERDQLLASKRKRPGFRLRAFHEMPITFAPTYKYDVGSDNYDTSEKKRVPAWCDRILSRGRSQERLEQLNYRRHEVRVSDHRPVSGLFQMTVKCIFPEKRGIVWAECKRKFREVKQRAADVAKYDFLMEVCGLDSKTCRELLVENKKVLC